MMKTTTTRIHLETTKMRDKCMKRRFECKLFATDTSGRPTHPTISDPWYKGTETK